MRTSTLHVLFGFFAALFVASQANIVAQLGPVTAEMFQLQVTFSADTFRSVLDGWTADELTRYRTHFAWDSVHPLIYGTLLVLWSFVVHRRRALSAWALRGLLTLAVAPSVLDYLENAFHLYLEADRQAITDISVMLAGGIANLKWLCAATVTVLLVLLSVRAMTHRRETPTARLRKAPVTVPVGLKDKKPQIEDVETSRTK